MTIKKRCEILRDTYEAELKAYFEEINDESFPFDSYEDWVMGLGLEELQELTGED